ncbi:hypothetical protein IFM51744_06263 [Aspergillus udagawae]|uniref:CCHC-type domain-containing protein n=1 Tax=Aspergillus udagawae TaxID=91492 RepID=A0ABQ1APU2_9EURO|nr:hypothetical protein IFM51744_06263 [Aspergillus udagawae]GFF85881.1 hypothetical protein IFM53868_04629 [Aspergillus udagawae]
MFAPLSVFRGLAFVEGRLSIGVSCAKLLSYHFEAGIRPLGGINVPDPMDLSSSSASLIISNHWKGKAERHIRLLAVMIAPSRRAKLCVIFQVSTAAMISEGKGDCERRLRRRLEDQPTPFWRDNTCALAGFLNLGPLGWRIQGCTLVCHTCRERGHIARNCPEVGNVRLIYQPMSNRDFGRRSPRARGGGGHGGLSNPHAPAAAAPAAADPVPDPVPEPDAGPVATSPPVNTAAADFRFARRNPGHYPDDLLGYTCGQILVLGTDPYHGDAP